MTTTNSESLSKSNWILRHWRGEISLVKSFWINSLVLPLGITIGLYGISMIASMYAGNIDLMLGVTPVLAGIGLCLIIWAGVGTWRSSGRELTRDKKLWPIVARLFCILLILTPIIGLTTVLLPWP